MGSGEIRNCSVDITVIGGMQNAGDNVAIRVSDGNFKIKDAALNLTVGKDRKGNVQNAKQGACVFATGRISIENSYINAGIYSALGQGAAYYATLQGQGGITCTDSVIYAESDVLKAGRTICLDGGDTTFSVKNSIFNAKGNQYAVYGYKYAKPTFENSLVELASEDVVMCGPTFGTISGFTKITATDKNGGDTTYKPGDDLSTLSTDSRKVVIESQIHSHCVCGGENAAEGHTVHSPLMWTPWTKTDSLPTAAGNYYLTGNVLLKSNSDYFMPDGVQICLNGYGISGADVANKPKLYANAGTLTVTDCGTKGSIGNVMMSSGELFMYGGSIPEGSELVIGKNGAFNAANGGGIDGKVTNGGVIFGGIFDGEAVNDGGTLKDGIFNGRIDLKSGNVIGGIYYGRVTYGRAVIRDSACHYLTFDTDGGSAMDAQRVLRGQKATPPTENPVKTGYIFSGWTGFDYTKPMLDNAKATAIWTVCDHSGNTTQLSCTDPVACSVCGGTIAALGHDFSASVWHHDGDTHWKKCARCDARNDENPHVWDNGKVTVPSTCLTEGNRVFTCDECGATKNEPIPATGHSWKSDWTSDATHHWHECANENCDVTDNTGKKGYAEHSGGKATCTQKANCTVCGVEYGNALGHDFTVRQYDNDNHWMKCSRCDEIENKSSHTWDSGTVTTAPTCTKGGKKTYTCTVCHATKTESINATGHNWKSDWTSDATHHWHECANENCDVTDNAGKDGYAEHSGGTATCTEKAVCTHCGQSYGETNPVNHTGTEQWTQTTTTHEKKWNCCNTVSVPNENHEWADGVCSECGYVCLHEDTDKNHICDICGKTISDHKDADNNHLCDYCGEKISNHTGGKATCIAKAVCEICKESYGSLDPNNHTDLKHIDAKAATAAEEGNIEYWYCSGCKKYYKDAKATQEITEAQIVTAKLPSDNNGSNNKPGNNATTSPQTGDNSNFALWIALLFISGGAVTVTTVYGRKKKHSVK